jgi:preprotein translocase subunit SecY
MKDLRSRIFFTLGMLAIFRLGVHVPAPGVDREALSSFINSNSGTMFGLYDMFSGGALQQFSVFFLGVMPYITASILMQILTVIFPPLERLSKEGQQGRNQITQYTRYASILVAIVQSLSVAYQLESMRTGANADMVLNPGWEFRAVTVITMTAGSCFVMWLGEQISERGIGNGSSLLITAGIVSGIPHGLLALYQKITVGELVLTNAAALGALMVVVVGLICWIERAQRRIPISYAKRVIGRAVYGGQSSHLPLKINTTGVIPPIFASSLLILPVTLVAMVPQDSAASGFLSMVSVALQPGNWLYMYVYVGLIVFFSYFYTAIMFNPVDVADNLKKSGAYIPGIRPGKQTADFIDRLLMRLTGAGALYLAAVCILPTLVADRWGVPFSFGGTGLLIVVGVSMDTVAQIEAQLLTKYYDGIQGPMVGGRRKFLIHSANESL